MLEETRIPIVTVLALLGACGDPQIRGCDLDDTFQDNSSEITVYAVMPSDCPVPLGVRGEEKFIGATVVDGGTRDYSHTTVNVTKWFGGQVGSDLASFVRQGDLGPWASTPKAFYPAGTGYTGTITPGQMLPNQANDVGEFKGILLGSGAVRMRGKLTVTYKGANVNADIGGPDVPLAGSEGTWYGGASGGSSPYSYAWYRNGQLVSTSSSYSANVGSEEFGLRLVVTDQVTSSRWTDYWVRVDGVIATISGPTLIYYSEGNATWNASYRGGYSPHTVTWHALNENGQEYSLGSGTSLSWYPPSAGQWSLWATVLDSHGTRSTSPPIYITAIGDGNGGCVPTPPQIICDP